MNLLNCMGSQSPGVLKRRLNIPVISCITYLNSEKFRLFPHNEARNGLKFPMYCAEFNLIQPVNDVNVQIYVVHAVSLAANMKLPGMYISYDAMNASHFVAYSLLLGNKLS